MHEGMAVGEKLRNEQYKFFLVVLKTIPMLLAICHILNVMLAYFEIDLVFLSYIGSVSLLPMAFLYMASYVFRFCFYHRMFLHYIVMNNGLTIYDYYIGLPITDSLLFGLHIGIIGLFLFIILYRYVKCHKRFNVKDN